MANLIDLAIAQLTNPLLWLLCAVGLVTGLVRGFSGFGTGMVFIPAASAVFQPSVAVIIIWMMDSVPTVPIVIPALRKVVWRQLIPVALGYACFVSLGVWILVTIEPTILRWVISTLVLACLCIVVSGWAWRGKRPVWLSFIVGAVSGVMGGAAALPVPPALAFWRAIKAPPAVVRANFIILILASEVIDGIAYFWGGLFTTDAMVTGLIVTPFYLVGLLVGQALFNDSAEKTYWRVATAVILLSAIIGLPLFDSLWGISV